MVEAAKYEMQFIMADLTVAIAAKHTTIVNTLFQVVRNAGDLWHTWSTDICDLVIWGRDVTKTQGCL